jgi:hypothetical protein
VKAVLLALGLLLCLRAPALGQGDGDAAKEEARVLLKEGVKLLGKKRYDDALAKFRAGYAKFPSAKLLLNIASTFKEMGSAAEAANAYQRYLDAPDTDAARRAEVSAILARLDASLGTLAIAPSEADAEVQIGDGEWSPLRLVRVAPGPYVVRARKDGFVEAALRGTVAKGERVDLALALAAVPPLPDAPAPTGDTLDPAAPPAVVAHRAPRRASRFGVLVDVAIDGNGDGVAVAPGVSVALHPRVQLALKGLFSGSQGAFAGVTAYLGGGALQPLVGVGVPVFFSDGVRAGVRGAGGVAWSPSARLRLSAEVGVEYFFNAEDDRAATILVPVLGAHARL